MRIGILALALIGASSAASAMDVATFLAKADALKSRGPLALLSSDLGLLKSEAVNAGQALRTERIAQVAAGKPTAYCPPANSSMNSEELLAAMRAIPAADRSRLSVQAAMKALMVRKYPCKG